MRKGCFATIKLKLNEMKVMRNLLAVILILSVNEAMANGEDKNAANGKTTINQDDVYGLITDADSDKPLKDVTVTAILLSKKEKASQSDYNGEYAIDELKPGIYKLVFEKDGYKRVVKEKVVIKANATTLLNIEMEQGSGRFDMMPSPFHFFEYMK